MKACTFSRPQDNPFIEKLMDWERRKKENEMMMLKTLKSRKETGTVHFINPGT